MTKDQETKIEIATRFMRYCFRYDCEAETYETLRITEAELDRRGDMQAAKDVRKKQWSNLCTLALVAENIHMQIRAMASYFRLSIADAENEMQTVCNWLGAQERPPEAAPDVRQYAERSLAFHRGWETELDRRTAFKSA